jgi:hypothetical protein
LPNTVIIPLYVAALLLAAAFALFKRVMVRFADAAIHSAVDPERVYGQFKETAAGSATESKPVATKSKAKAKAM